MTVGELRKALERLNDDDAEAITELGEDGDPWSVTQVGPAAPRQILLLNIYQGTHFERGYTIT